jgi:hypothetical protein
MRMKPPSAARPASSSSRHPSWPGPVTVGSESSTAASDAAASALAPTAAGLQSPPTLAPPPALGVSPEPPQPPVTQNKRSNKPVMAAEPDGGSCTLHCCSAAGGRRTGGGQEVCGCGGRPLPIPFTLDRDSTTEACCKTLHFELRARTGDWGHWALAGCGLTRGISIPQVDDSFKFVAPGRGPGGSHRDAGHAGSAALCGCGGSPPGHHRHPSPARRARPGGWSIWTIMMPWSDELQARGAAAAAVA